MKIPFVIFALMLYLGTIMAQELHFGFTGNIGHSEALDKGELRIEATAMPALSGNLGIFIEKSFGSRSTVGIEGLALQIESKDGINNSPVIINSGNLQQDGTQTFKTRFHLTYLALPIYYRLNLKKWSIQGGVQPMVLLAATADFQVYWKKNDGSVLEVKNKIEELYLQKINIGPKVGLGFQVCPAFRLRLDYFHSMIPLIKSDNLVLNRTTKQLTIGLNFLLE